MLVYVINQYKKPMMPCKPSIARKLLKQKKAKVVSKQPFTIQLLYGSSGYKQEINLGVDCGSRFIGLSVTTKNQELFSAELGLRNDIVNLISTRRQYRSARRSRLRYRKPRFLNRTKRKTKGWLSPSVENKIQTHLNIINKIYKILPITKCIVEVASFDIQKINNPNISGVEYQQGDMLGFWNLREYILHRDEHKCQNCKGKSKDKILNIHHIKSRQVGSDAPTNLITLCKTCHNNFHKGVIKLNIKNNNQSYKDATFMNIMKWTFFNRLQSLYKNVIMTYGYITKSTRISNNLSKGHNIDAFCIANNINAKRLNYYYYIKQVRKHNRQIHKAKILKGNIKKLNQAPYRVKGFRLFDKIRYDNKVGFIFGRRSSGYFDIRFLDGTNIHKNISYKKLKLIDIRRTLLFEKRDNITCYYK